MFDIVRKDFKVDPDTGKVIQEDKTETIIEYCFMTLSNLTATEEGQKHLLGLEHKSKFIIVESVFGMFCYFSKNTAFDFVSNIMANLACLSEGRQFMIDNKYIEAMTVQMISKDLNKHRRKFLITCLRNLLFEYEKYQDKFE